MGIWYSRGMNTTSYYLLLQVCVSVGQEADLVAVDLECSSRLHLALICGRREGGREGGREGWLVRMVLEEEEW